MKALKEKPKETNSWVTNSWVKSLGGIILLFLVLFGHCLTKLEKCSENNLVYKHSSAGYEMLNSEIGCYSKYSKAKKRDIFNSLYKDHWMVWKGVVVLADADSVSLNIDNKGTQDLTVTFENKNAGYNLMEGDIISVQFVMKSTGGCFLPFSGKKATILKWAR